MSCNSDISCPISVIFGSMESLKPSKHNGKIHSGAMLFWSWKRSQTSSAEFWSEFSSTHRVMYQWPTALELLQSTAADPLLTQQTSFYCYRKSSSTAGRLKSRSPQGRAKCLVFSALHSNNAASPLKISWSIVAQAIQALMVLKKKRITVKRNTAQKGTTFWSAYVKR